MVFMTSRGTYSCKSRSSRRELNILLAERLEKICIIDNETVLLLSHNFTQTETAVFALENAKLNIENIVIQLTFNKCHGN